VTLFHEDGRTDVATRIDACSNCFASATKNYKKEIRHRGKQRREFSLHDTQSTARFHQKTTSTSSGTVLPVNLPPGRNTHTVTLCCLQHSVIYRSQQNPTALCSSAPPVLGSNTRPHTDHNHRALPPSTQANAGRTFILRHDRFLPHPFPFISHKSPHHWATKSVP
jgi:hypothetical protein